MKFFTLLLASVAVTLAQDNGSATGGVCEPHEDHWHCPAGVPEPTYLPGAQPATINSVTTTLVATTATESHDHDHEDEGSVTVGTTCEPHGDHWHCPSGVAEPTTAPGAETTGGEESEPASPTTPSATQFTGAAVTNSRDGGIAMVALGAFGALFI